jgi:FKBP-type peptidyl-prolyl cis-trans isomerase (trigger factor)
MPQPEVKTEVTALPESKVKIAATVPAEEVDKRLQSAARSFANEMKMPGFRKGRSRRSWSCSGSAAMR